MPPTTKNPVSDKALKLFASDLQTYGKVCLKIRTQGGYDHRTKRITPPQLTPLAFNATQQIVHEDLKKQWARCGRIRAMVLKARQQGVSTYTAGRFFRKLHLWPNHQALVVADELTRAQWLYGMYDRFAHNLPEEMRPMMRYVSKQKEMIFDNPKDALRAEAPGLDSGIAIETAGDTEAGKGHTIHLAHLSEMATWPNALEVMLSLLQAVPDYGSEIIIESTAKGVGNLFHQMWVQAEEGEGVTEGPNGYLAIFIPWWWHERYRINLTPTQRKALMATADEYEDACMTTGFAYRGKTYKLKAEQLAWRRMTIREKCNGDRRLFEQEYPATPDEAFIASGACFFDEDALKDYNLGHDENNRPYAVRPVRRRATLISVHERGIIVSPQELGWLRIWKRPGEDDRDESPIKSRYVIGADTATGRAVAAVQTTFDSALGERWGRDFSSAHVIDVVRRELVAELHGRMAPEIFAEQLNLLGRLYSSEERTGLRQPALLAPEANHSSGTTVIRVLKDKFLYPNIYLARTIGRRFEKKNEGQRLGWLTTRQTRMPMLDNLAALIRDRGIAIPCKDTIRECLTFVRGEDGIPAAQEGAHDDRVISFGIACWLMDIDLPPTTDFKPKQPYIGDSPTGMFSYG